MKQGRVKVVLVGAIVALLVLILTEIFWVRKLVESETRLFQYQVNIALSRVAGRIQLFNSKSISDIHPIERVTPNTYVVKINDIVQPQLLDSLLHNEFGKLHIDLPYQYALYDCFTDSVVYRFSDQIEAVHAREYNMASFDKDSYNFGVVFPTYGSLTSQLRVGGFALMVVIIFAVFSVYVVWVIIRQKRVDQMKTDFINNMTHELKTPIATIDLSAQSLLKEKVQQNKERLENYAGIILEENTRLKNQVEKVLQIAILDKGEQQFSKEPISVHFLLQSVVGGFGLVLESRNGQVDFSLNAQHDKVQGDKVHLSNVFFNLIDNAVKYCDTDPRIQISTRDRGNGIEVSIRDNGVGMSREAQRHVFDRFYRVPTGNVHNVKGFGLGLNYVKWIIEFHEGTVRVASEPGNGSEFIIFLPYGSESEYITS